MVTQGYVQEIKFEMDGRTVIAWLPPERDPGDELALRLPSLRAWMIEVDGNPAIQGPLDSRVPLGQEARVEQSIRNFLRMQ